MIRTLSLYGALLAFVAAVLAAILGSIQFSLAAGFAGLFLLTVAQLDARSPR